MHADNDYCPTIDTESRGYLINRLPDRLVEVHFLDDRLTREVIHSRPGRGMPPTDESILFEGLITLSTASGTTYTPLGDLSSMFPLQVGDEHQYSMRLSWSGRDQHIERKHMRVLRKLRKKVGQCQYDVFELRITFLSETDSPYGIGGSPNYLYYYCPALRGSVLVNFNGWKPKVGTLHPLSERDELLARLRAVLH